MRYLVSPPYLLDSHFTARLPQRRHNRQLALYDLGTRLGVRWLTRLGEWAHVRTHGHRFLEQLNTGVHIFTSTYLVIVVEAALRGNHSTSWVRPPRHSPRCDTTHNAWHGASRDRLRVMRKAMRRMSTSAYEHLALDLH